MMSTNNKIKRFYMNVYYDAFDNYCQIEVEEDEDGGWVRYTDHKKIVVEPI